MAEDNPYQMEPEAAECVRALRADGSALSLDAAEWIETLSQAYALADKAAGEKE